MTTTLQQAIVGLLEADNQLTDPPSAGLGFTVWNRGLKREGKGNTEGAFRIDEPGKPLGRAIVVWDATENDSPARQPADVKRIDAYPTAHLYVETTDTGKLAADQAYRRIEALFLGWSAVLDSGERLGFVSGSRNTLNDSDQFEGSKIVVVRWRFTGSRRLVAA